MSNKVTVTIDGRRYIISSDSDTEYMTAVANDVNERMTELRKALRSCSSADCATMTALNLADDLYQERLASEDIRRQLIQALDENRRLTNQLKEAGKQPKPQKKTPRGRPKNADRAQQDQVQIPLAGEFVPGEDS